MNMDIYGVIVSFLYFYLVLITAQKIGKNVEISRKYAHIMIGNWYIIAILVFRKLVPSLIVPTFFAVYGADSIYFRKNEDFITSLLRKGNGSGIGIVLFPISLIIMLISSFLYYHSFVPGGIGVMALTYGDSMAALIGETLPIFCFTINNKKKSLFGCTAMTIFSMISIFLYEQLFYSRLPYEISFPALIVIGGVAGIIELITPSGFDNLSIPVAIFACYILLGII